MEAEGEEGVPLLGGAVEGVDHPAPGQLGGWMQLQGSGLLRKGWGCRGVENIKNLYFAMP